MNNNRAVEDYRQHKLLAAHDDDRVKGRAWKDNKLVAECEGKTIDSVISTLQARIDERLNEIASSRIGEPSVSEYVDALKRIEDKLSDGQRAMLKAHYRAPDKCMTATALAEAAGYPGYSSANLQYGLVGRWLFEELPVPLGTLDDGTPIYTSALADAGSQVGPEGFWIWKMRPGVAAALAHLGIVS